MTREKGDGRGRGAAWYQQAEAYRVHGDFAAAEDAYRQASRWGREPQPGLALLRLAEGKRDAAVAAIQRVVAETTERLVRARLLPAQVLLSQVGNLLIWSGSVGFAWRVVRGEAGAPVGVSPAAV